MLAAGDAVLRVNLCQRPLPNSINLAWEQKIEVHNTYKKIKLETTAILKPKLFCSFYCLKNKFLCVCYFFYIKYSTGADPLPTVPPSLKVLVKDFQ